jgi:hypothetical protein
MDEEQNAMYSEFIKAGLLSGFTDDQINFMWEFVMMSVIAVVKMRK